MNDLDQLLHDWAARNEPSEEALETLQIRVLEKAGSPNLHASHKSVSHMAEVSRHRSSLLPVIAAAVALMLAVGVLISDRRDQMPTSSVPPLPNDSIAVRQSLFSELDRMFAGHWRWLGEVNGRLHLQTDDEPAGEMSAANDGVAVRLVVVKRLSGESNWQIVWEASVVTRSDEWVELPQELTGPDTIAVWSHPLPDGSVLVESNVTLTAPVTVRSSDQQVFRTSARPARLWSDRRPDGEYQLIQTVARLETNHG